MTQGITKSRVWIKWLPIIHFPKLFQYYLVPQLWGTSLLYVHSLHLILGKKLFKISCSRRIWFSTKFMPAVSIISAVQTLSRFEFNSSLSEYKFHALHVPFELEFKFLLFKFWQWALCFIILEILARTPVSMLCFGFLSSLESHYLCSLSKHSDLSRCEIF